MIMTSLEAAMGRRFAAVVEEFLAAGSTNVKETEVNEHNLAFDLEMRARDTIQAIAEAV